MHQQESTYLIHFLKPLLLLLINSQLQRLSLIHILKAAALNGWIDEKRIVMENMLAFKRAGAKIIITYHALDVAKWIKEM